MPNTWRNDYFAGNQGEDVGCRELTAWLGRPVTCLACSLPKCLYDLTPEERYEVEAKLKLIGGFHSNEELADMLTVRA